MDYPYTFHVALDGNGLNGLEGKAGVCVFRYHPLTGQYEYDIQYFDGLAGGHAVSVNPSHRVGFLGSTSQQLLFYNCKTLKEVTRLSTLKLEPTTSSIHGSTHAVWLNNSEFIVAIGDGLWKLNLEDLESPVRLGDHGVKLPHALKLTPSGRYLVYGSMDHPDRGEARELGIFDLKTGKAQRVELPTTSWHIVCHPSQDLVYALSFRVQAPDRHNWHEWSMAQFKEYAFEIDVPAARVNRHWSADKDTPAHINSDVCLSNNELIFCNGASGSIVMIDLKSFSSFRVIDVKPSAIEQVRAFRQASKSFVEVLARGSFLTHSNHHLRAILVSRGTLIDSVYACQLSADQSLLFTANRGLNTITIYNYPENTVRREVRMPELQKFDKSLCKWSDPRLGFHHSVLLSPKNTK